MRCAGVCRITSYNVCYTKLLRNGPGPSPTSTTRYSNAARVTASEYPTSVARASPTDPARRSASSRNASADRADNTHGTTPADGASSVITSYSIHYTKLYEASGRVAGASGAGRGVR
ncbi:hypothetical protein [Streptomyces cyaneogriseus]|uniref:hypothetical protein n=1 Tax=Streptomyces cyaneogriseus TaxID=68192 RepID=UPI0013312915|nr:hypothetical protein [Streptomyces cyaneogriseus]